MGRMSPRGYLLIVAAAIGLAGAAAAAEPAATTAQPQAKPAKRAPRRYVELKSGVYDCELGGMICLACAGMVEEELKRVDGVLGAWVDFEARVLRVEIKPKRVVPLNAIKRGLARATRRIDLGTSFTLGAIRYVP